MIFIFQHIKDGYRSIKILAFFFAILCIIAIPSKAKQKLTFTAMSKGEPGGLIILQTAYQRLGIDINHIKLPPERALYAVNVGWYDGMIVRSAGVEKQYPNLIRVPVPIFFIDKVAVSKKAGYPITSWDSLTPYSVGYIRGDKTTENNLNARNSSKVSVISQLFLMLNSNRIQVAICPKIAALYYQKQLDIPVFIHKPPLERTPLFHYINKTHLSLLKPITKVLEEMQQSGQIEQLNHEYYKRAVAPVSPKK